MASSRKSRDTDRSPVSLEWVVRSCLERHAAQGHRVVLGLSGGVDSVSLLHVLLNLVRSGSFAIHLSAVHVHHGLSANAALWEAFCLDLCAAGGLDCQVVRVQVIPRGGEGVEAAARRARHAVFSALDTDWVLLAHQRDDQAETLLFNLLRGTGVLGAAAMRECNGRLLRPFLMVDRVAIEAYARWHGLDWCEDESNLDTRYSRNFLRREVFPGLKPRFPAAIANFSHAASRFGEAAALLDDLAYLDLGGESVDFPIRVEQLKTLDEARARNALRCLLTARGVRIPSEARLREALRQMLAAGVDRHPSVHLGPHRLYRKGGLIYLDVGVE